MVMLVSASLERLMPSADRPTVVVMPVAVSCVALALVTAYGSYRLGQPVGSEDKSLKVSLIQGSFDTDFSGSQETTRKAFLDYVRLTKHATRRLPDADLVVWPESMFTANEPCMSFDEPLQLIPEWESLDALKARLDESIEYTRDKARWVSAEAGGAPLLVGTSWNHLRGTEVDRYNSALLIQPGGKIADRYDKMHPVMFGEYVPLSSVFPFLEALSPMGPGLTAGAEPKSIVIEGVRIAPNICFENTVPQLIRRQVRQLAAAGQDPELLITITNDGWFWGSSLLDVHLACGVFRAIEMRRPLLIAANTGFSAHIDAHGQIVKKGPRRAEAIVGVLVKPSTVKSPYLMIGDSLAAVCLLISAVAVAWELTQRWR
jgi:apolipoprotein N-acyltransferase